MIKVKRSEIKEILQGTIPDYRGNKIEVTEFYPMKLSSYWDNGYRDYYYFYHLPTGKVSELGQTHPYFDRNKAVTNEKLMELPVDIILVKRSYAGTSQYVIIYANSANIPKMLNLGK